MPCGAWPWGVPPSPSAHRPHCGKPRASPHGPRAVATQAPEPVLQADQPPRKVAMVSLGCPKNTVDGEVLLGDLRRAGWEVGDDPEDCDAVLVNTCAFVEDAKRESLEAVIEAARLKGDGGRVKAVAVTGCLAQRYGIELRESLPEADLLVGFQEYDSLPSSLAAALGNRIHSGATAGPLPQRLQVGAATVPFRPEGDRHRLTPQHTAYLRVAEGCSHACTFCAIPGFRGKFRSKPWAAAVDEARSLVADGARELCLIAEDTNQCAGPGMVLGQGLRYGMDRRDGRGLAALLRELGTIEGLAWIRILYAYPSYFDDELIDEIAANSKVCKYIDIPLQHIANLVLLGMARPPRDHTLALLARLRARIPRLALRTTFICGFPGETAADHEELLRFCREFRFERCGAFAYSEEDGTPAAAMPDQVPEDVRAERRDELVSQAQDICAAFAASLVGQEVDVLVDGYDEDGMLTGRTQWDAPDVDPLVFLSPPLDDSLPSLEVGQMRRCRVSATSVFDLEAYPVV